MEEDQDFQLGDNNQEETDKEQDNNLEEADTTLGDGRIKPKRKRQRTKSLDYVDHSPGSSVSDSSECDQSDKIHKHDEDIKVELYQVLDQLHGKCDKPTVSHWTTPLNDALVGKYFKMKRRLVSLDDFVLCYFWAGETYLYEKWQKSPEIQTLLNFVELSTAAVNVSETELFLPAEVSPDKNREVISEEIWNAAKKILRTNSRQHDLDIIDSRESLAEIAIQLRVRVCAWMKFLSEVVRPSPDMILKAAYEQLFVKYLEQFNLKCLNGNFEKLCIPYTAGKSISSVPDILFSLDDRRSHYCGVVEVKRMILDPSFKHAFNEVPNEGILGCTSEESRRTKKRCVNFGSEGATEKAFEEYEDPEDNNNAAAFGIRGSRLPESFRQLIRLFFGQLFGSVLALDCQQPSEKARRLGIGVVGFRVMFFAFYAKPDTAFKDIPCEERNRMEVQVTRPLSMLIAADRKEIAKIVLQIADRKPL